MEEQTPRASTDEHETPGERYLAQRRFFSVLLVFLAAAFFLGGLQVWNAIRSPFAPSSSASGRSDGTENLGPTASVIASLSSKDTDNDGLNDYDELYRYQTSPYLADSDSDGAPDRDEVTNGKNPNCPEGQACTPIAFTGTEAATNVTNATTNTASGADAASLADLRQTLKSAGAPAATLDAMSDDELRALYREVTGEEFGGQETTDNGQQTTANSQQSPNGNASFTTNAVSTLNGSGGGSEAINAAPTNVNAESAASAKTLPSVSAATLEDLQQLTPNQIRQFLERGGADPGSLDDIDDETLRTIFLEALQNVASTGT